MHSQQQLLPIPLAAADKKHIRGSQAEVMKGYHQEIKRGSRAEELHYISVDIHSSTTSFTVGKAYNTI